MENQRRNNLSDMTVSEIIQKTEELLQTHIAITIYLS